jgi:hypothetical protein
LEFWERQWLRKTANQNVEILEFDKLKMKLYRKIHPKIIGSTIAATHTTPDKSQIQIQSRS